MSEKNLMDFESPKKTDTLLDIKSDSPGSNPFDTLLKTSERCQDSFFAPIDMDCGRESLGILHIDFEKLHFNENNWSNLPTIKLNEELYQERHDISTNLNTAFLYSDTLSRSNKLSNSSSIDSRCSYSGIYDVPLNTAFLYSNRNNKLSASTSFCSSIYAHSEIFELDELSKIYPINKTYKICDGEFSFRFNDNLEHPRPRLRSCPTVLQNGFRKSESLLRKSFMAPQLLREPVLESDDFNDSVFIEGKHIASKLANESIYDAVDGELDSLDCTPQPEWVDVCDDFDENVAVSKEEIFKSIDKLVPNKSDVNSPINTETNFEDKIDKTPDDEYSKPLDNSPINTETNLLEDKVCKTPNESKNANKLDNTSSSSSSSRNECLSNLSDIFNDKKRLSTSRLSHCSNNSQSKDAKSLLSNLSVILNSENPSNQQKQEGQHLLFSLADILYSSDVKNSEREQSEDSGNSSIEQDVNKEDSDAMDLRINKEIPDDQPLDLSISKKKDQSTSVEPPTSETRVKKFKNTQIDRSKNESTNSNDKSNSLKANISELSALGKLKPKKIDRKIVPEKGPLKAMIPVGSMSKPKGSSKTQKIDDTPPRGNQYAAGYKNKHVGRSNNESKLRPIAQSTPEGNSSSQKYAHTSSQLPQRRYGSPVSSLTRTNSIKNESTEELNKKNRSGSTPNLTSCNSKNNSSTQPTQYLYRRRSASEIKLPNDVNKFRRSNTIDKDSHISSTMNRVRNNVEKARHSIIGVRSAGITKTGPSKLTLGERNRPSTPPGIKPCNLVNKMKTGKENKLK